MSLITLSYRVGSAIIQRYLDKVLDAALSPYEEIQKVAVDILSLTIMQGLAHPIQVSSYESPSDL